MSGTNKIYPHSSFKRCDTPPHIPARPGQSVLRKIVAYLVILSLTFAPLAAYPAPDTATKDPENTTDQKYKLALSRLDEFMRLVTQLRSHIDKSQFETGALLEKLDFDVDKIIKFVTNDINFEQYAGLLRGAQGTLMSRAGNSLDQAVLLATLLNDAAYESRVVRGELNRTQINTLLQQMGRKKSKQISGDLEKYKDIFKRMARLAAIPEDKINLFAENSIKNVSVKDTGEYQDAIDSRNFILDKIEKLKGKIEPLDITDELVKEARDYFWVEVRLGQSTKWKSVHPTFPDAGTQLKSIRRTGVMKNKIPSDLQHRFRIQAFVEQKTGNKLTSRAIMPPWESASANLVGKSLHFSNVPDGFRSNNDISEPEKVAKTTNFLMPTFKVNEKSAAKTEFFDMDGVVVDRMAAGDPSAPLFQTLGKKMEKALQGSASLGTKKKTDEGEFRALSAQWIEFTQISPGGREKKVKRYVIDRIGAANREQGITAIENYKNREKAIWKLASTNKFILSSGTYPESYIFDRYLKRILSSRPLFKASLEQTFYPSRPISFKLDELNELTDSPELLVADSFDRLNQLEQMTINYRHVPALLILKNEFTYEESSISTNMVVDIVNNSQRILKQEGNRILYEPAKNILFGTWATRLEELNLLTTDIEQVSYWNTRKAFQQAAEQQIAVRLLKPEDTAKVSQIAGISTETRQAILRDLGNDYHVIIPEKTTDKSKNVGWWRVNTRTGETLGRINEGLGGEATKYTILLNLVALKVAILLAYPGYADCKNKPQKDGSMCSPAGCLAGAGVGILAGYTVGYAVGLIAAALAAPGALLVGVAGVSSYAVKAPGAIRLGIEIGVARGMDIANATKVIPQLPNCIE